VATAAVIPVPLANPVAPRPLALHVQLAFTLIRAQAAGKYASIAQPGIPVPDLVQLPSKLLPLVPTRLARLAQRLLAQQATIAQTQVGITKLTAPQATTLVLMQVLAQPSLQVTTVLDPANLRAQLAPTLSMVAILAKCVLPATTVPREPIALLPALQVPTLRVTLPLPLVVLRVPTRTTAL
jgi:hypothetical protein